MEYPVIVGTELGPAPATQKAEIIDLAWAMRTTVLINTTTVKPEDISELLELILEYHQKAAKFSPKEFKFADDRMRESFNMLRTIFTPDVPEEIKVATQERLEHRIIMMTKTLAMINKGGEKCEKELTRPTGRNQC